MSSLPHVYDIDVAELDPLKVRCLWHTITSSAAPSGLAFVEIDKPDGGSVPSGVPLPIRWTSSGAHTFSVSASSDDGSTWRPIQECGSIAATECRWNNPSPASVNTRVRVEAYSVDGGLLASDVSARFTIRPAATGDDRVVLYAAHAEVAGGWTVTPDAAPPAGRGCRTRTPAPPSSRRRWLADPVLRDAVQRRGGRGYRLWIRRTPNRTTRPTIRPTCSSRGVAQAAPGLSHRHDLGDESNLEDCGGCGLSGWGWQDNGYGTGVLGPAVFCDQRPAADPRAGARGRPRHRPDRALASEVSASWRPARRRTTPSFCPKWGRRPRPTSCSTQTTRRSPEGGR